MFHRSIPTLLFSVLVLETGAMKISQRSLKEQQAL